MTHINHLQKLIGELNNQTIINAILNNLDVESIDVYAFLKKEYCEGNIGENLLFQFVYRSFYRLDNAGLTPEFKTKYFELMNKQNDDLKDILNKLLPFKNRKGQQSVQFSFATKLMNTLNQDLPIYDSQVASILKLKKPYDKNKFQRINNCIEIYQDLRGCINYLLGLNLKIIAQFRNNFNVTDEMMNDVKVLDFVLWSYGNMVGKSND